MNSVLMSIRPKWCELIGCGKKTIEVRKSRPRIDTPFKVYMYCSRERLKHGLHLYVCEPSKREKYGTFVHWRNGNDVVDVNPHLPAYRFNCYLAEGNVIGEFVCDKIYELAPLNHAPDDTEQRACLSHEEIAQYLKGKGYAWNITNVRIFGELIPISQFRNVLTRPPQSWRYIEKGGTNVDQDN